MDNTQLTFHGVDARLTHLFEERNSYKDLFSRQDSCFVKGVSIQQITDDIQEYFAGHGYHLTIRGLNNIQYVLQNENDIIISILKTGTPERDEYLYDDDPSNITYDSDCNDSVFTYTGTRDAVKLFSKYLTSNYPSSGAKVYWWYINRSAPSHISVNLAEPSPIYDEFYPYIKQGPYRLFDDYLRSNCPILLLSGVPGTGKTSFLRSMLHKYRLRSYVGYDMRLFESDQMFIEFISGPVEVLIMEDSENLVLPRAKNSESSMMSRFLNVSDGLIKFPNKKFIFTTNETDFNNVDPALLRPGRCYGSLDFRALTYAEAADACNVAKLELPKDEKTYTLAELFNQTQRMDAQPKKFGIRP